MSRRHRQTLAILIRELSFASVHPRNGWQKQCDLTAVGTLTTLQRFVAEGEAFNYKNCQVLQL